MRKTFHLGVFLCLASVCLHGLGQAGENTNYVNPGMEIADFINAATRDRLPHDKILSNNAGAGAARVEPLMIMAMVSMYDMVDNPKGKNTADKRQGKTKFMMLTDVDAVREKSGDVIKFTGKKVYDQETNTQDKGDVWTQSGSLDIAKGFLSLETTVERQGKIVDRYVFEMAALPKGIWLTQFLQIKTPDRFNRNKQPQISCFFSRFDGKEYRHVVAGKPAQIDFAFTSLAGKGDVSPDAMADGYQISTIATIKGDVFTLETPKN